MLRKHLVIVGGGWAGLSLIRNLKNEDFKKIRITLISDDANFRYTPALYRVASGHREREGIIPIGDVLNDIDHVEFMVDAAKKIDRASRKITTKSGKVLHYDFAVIALGMKTSYFGIPGIEENSYGIKSLSQLRELRKHLEQEIIEDQKPDKNYVVVGAGPTGIELAAAMHSYLGRLVKKHNCRRQRISLEVVEAAPRVAQMLQPRASKKIQKRLRKLGIKIMLNAKVESETPTSLQVNGKSIPTETVIWTAGVTNNPFFKNNPKQFELDARGKVILDKSLKVDPYTYVIGDNAATQYSGLALTAVHNAKFVAKDIKRQIRGKKTLAQYKPITPITVIPAGPRWAIMQYRSIVISGLLGALLRTAADFIGYADILGFRKAFAIWLPFGDKED